MKNVYVTIADSEILGIVMMVERTQKVDVKISALILQH
jgi:hypothetical protein